MNIISDAKTHRGNKRKNNQDAILHDDHNGLWVVADGMGGYEAGEIASQTITQSLANLAATGQTDILNIKSILEDVNEQLFEQNQQLERVVGSTVVAALFDGKNCTCLWAGDSRIYLYRDNHLVQISIDHSYVEELIQRGELSRKDSAHHKNSNIITRAIGIEAALQFDYKQIELQPEDRLLLCSDGLYNEISATEIAAILKYSNSSNAAAKQLLNLALSRAAKDNISVIVAEVVL